MGSSTFEKKRRSSAWLRTNPIPNSLIWLKTQMWEGTEEEAERPVICLSGSPSTFHYQPDCPVVGQRTQQKNCLHQTNLWPCLCRSFLIDVEGPAHNRQCHPWAGILSYGWVVAECESGSKQVSSFPLWFLLDFLPGISSVMDCDQDEEVKSMLSSSSLFWSECFITATELKLEYKIEIKPALYGGKITMKCPFLFVCVTVCIHMCICTCVCTSKWRSEVNASCLPQSHYTLLLRQAFPLNMELTHPGIPRGLPISTSLVLGLGVHYCAWILCGCCGSNPALSVCVSHIAHGWISHLPESQTTFLWIEC